MIDVNNVDLTEFPLRWYSEDFQARVLLWGEETSIICVDYDLWKGTMTVDTESLHKTKEGYINWKYNERYTIGSLVGFYENATRWGVGIVVEVEKIGNNVKLLIGEEIHPIEIYRVFKLKAEPEFKE